MRKQIYFCVVLLLGITTNQSTAQTQFGQIVLSAGFGESPGFNGDDGTGPQIFPYYPVASTLSSINTSRNTFYSENPPKFFCSSITPNLSGGIDVGVGRNFSIGFASSYQSEVVVWAPVSYGINYYTCSDKISRVNSALRFLNHAKMGKHFDFYAGIRIGNSYWHDIPSSTNSSNLWVNNLGISPYFINSANVNVPSFQILMGLRYFPIYNVGIHAEFGIGSPYLCEGGITFRINTKKEKTKSDAVTPANK